MDLFNLENRFAKNSELESRLKILKLSLKSIPILNVTVLDLWMSALTCWHKYGETFYSNGRAFTVEEQLYINRQACSAWQMGIVFGQFWNIWNTRTRRMSLFKHGLFANKSLLVALVAELFLINLYVYMPGNFLEECLQGIFELVHFVPFTCVEWLSETI